MNKKWPLVTIGLSAFILELLFGLFMTAGIAKAKQSKFVSSGKGFETDSAISENGTAFISFVDKRYGKKARVRKLEGNSWQDLAGGTSPNGLLSPGAAMNPVLDTKGQEVYVAFTDKTDKNRARVKKWDGSDWLDLADAGHPQGKISELAGSEPEMQFDRSKSNLYVAFWDAANGTRIRVMRWNGNSWLDCTDDSHPQGLVSESTAVEVNIAASKIDDSMFIAYQDAADGNRIRVKKWDGASWSDLSDRAHPSGYLSESAGFNPSITTDSNGFVYVAYPSPREGYLHAYFWNGSEWSDFNAPSSKKSAEVSLAIDGNDGLWIAYSEQYKKNRWALKLKKYSGGNWIDVPFGNRSRSKFIVKGKDKVDPAISYGEGKIFISFTDPASHRARSVSYDAAAY